MSTSVLQACELTDQTLPKFILIREEYGADASFLIASILGQCLKFQQNGVVLVCLHHLSQHYVNAGIRLGFNLTTAKDKGRIHLIEPLLDIGTDCLSSNYYLTAPKGEVVEALLNEIKENTHTQLQSKENVCIVIDNVAMFLYLGYSQDLILRLCHQLVHFVNTNDHVSLVLKVNLSHLNEGIVSSLEDYATSNITVSKLQSGEFQEVDGRIVCKKRTDRFKFAIKTILYKIGDRNVKAFQPGEVGIKV